MSFKLFRFNVLLILLVLQLTNCTNKTPRNNQFGAYYTNIESKNNITGKYADIVVKIGDNKEFVFCRDSCYLPYLKIGEEKWYVDELIKKHSDGTEKYPEIFNKYSYVRIIKNTSEQIIVHWRYIPDFRNINFKSVVHEYFSLTPDGMVRRIIKEGNINLDIYNNPKSQTIQEFKLTNNGINELSLKVADFSFEPHKAITGTPIINETVTKPVAWWQFDEGLKESNDNTFETIENIKCPITGNITLWKEGISGTALAFDGYDSKVVLDSTNACFFKNDFTIEAWLVLGAYPWEWGPVIDYTIDNNSGLYFGINSNGQTGIILNNGEEKIKLISKNQIPLYQWTHVAASFDRNNNRLSIYIDGEESGRINTMGKKFAINGTDLFIGRNKLPQKASDHVSRDYPPHVRTPLGNQSRIYGIEGLIDEIKIYDTILNDIHIRQLYNNTEPTTELKKNPDLEKRILPGEVNGENAENFGAYYTKLKYHELWDNLWRSSDYPDVVVKFDELPTSIVYWRGTNYGPAYVTENNRWMCDQSIETGTEYGCAEHMADKQNRYSHVRIIENTPARVVVHWRYASADITYALANEKAWTDEYHYIYPDGTLLRYVHYYNGEEGWQDLQFFSAPGTKQEDNIELKAMTIANIEGDVQEMDWTNGIPDAQIRHPTISKINFKSEYKVMVIFPKEVDGIDAWGVVERVTPETHFAGPWNHWPVGQMPNDGRYAMYADRITHSALGGSNPGNMAIYGFTNDNIELLIPVDKSWNYAPDLINIKGAKSSGYEREQKAFPILALAHEFSFTIDATENSPIQNPCFVIDNWNTKNKAILKINGKAVKESKSFRQGITLDETGREKLIIWLNIQTSSPVTVEISGAEPGI